MSRQKSQDAGGGVLAPARTASLTSDYENLPNKSNGSYGRVAHGKGINAWPVIDTWVTQFFLQFAEISSFEKLIPAVLKILIQIQKMLVLPSMGGALRTTVDLTPPQRKRRRPLARQPARLHQARTTIVPSMAIEQHNRQTARARLLKNPWRIHPDPDAENAGITLNGTRSKDARGSYALATQAPPSPRASTDTSPSHANFDRVADIRRSVLSEMHANLQAALSRSSFSSVDHTELSPPRVFISKWIDYSNKYGVGYHLRGGSVGVYFNDSTSLILAADKHHCEYLFYDRGDNPPPSLQRIAFTRTSYPPDLKKKMTLLDHFWGYMQDNLNTAVQDASQPQISQQTENLDFLTKYVRTHQGVIFRLSNQIVQLNLFDHSKIILSRAGLVVTYIDRDGTFATRSLASFLSSGNPDVRKRLCYLMEILSHMIAKKQKRAAAAVAAAEMSADARRGVLAERQGP
ncbi:Serine/threonine-protein kinase plk1 [Geranomyces variabilis]|uniref:Serine/threonine-protein kinase plk1 n=1 Tax=Geranomyces variabilis TaxID=109894 RepID=A0AAD5TDA7_9FUNG|nr:Serine/threonine-protein kinase plk1 [Geranomyces variabilis]